MIATATMGNATTGPTCSEFYDDDYDKFVCALLVYETASIKFAAPPLPKTITPRYIHAQAKNLLQTQNIKTNVRTRINNGRMK